MAGSLLNGGSIFPLQPSDYPEPIYYLFPSGQTLVFTLESGDRLAGFTTGASVVGGGGMLVVK